MTDATNNMSSHQILMKNADEVLEGNDDIASFIA